MKKQCETGVKKFFYACMERAFPKDTFYWESVSHGLKTMWWEMYVNSKTEKRCEEDM